MFSILLASLILSSDPVPPVPTAAGPTPAGGAPHMRRRIFLSPMGEPFRSEEQGVSDDPLQSWFERADLNHDGALSVQEMRKDADRFFASLDTDGDGEIAPVELNRYETEIAPEIQVGPRSGADRIRAWGGDRPPGEGNGTAGGAGRQGMSGGRPSGGHSYRFSDNGLQGAGRFSLLNIPEPVAAADADLNRGVSLEEFERAAGARFLMLDKDRDGKLTMNELRAIQQANEPELPNGKDRKHKGWRRPAGEPIPTGNVTP